ncbi:NAD(P) transhydrogenase subunit beta [BD1-7 clade bacterium]|uniref:NAD(P) transhydrogenase subunit beta n=1 Tax=BD1-7 clade bacterium TaxID=2029982 RepID=A0A5S9PNP7_9GAMM|nr:NAD(P) transhydrogenase subunit beta [BD1-7 clade bacterium]CAA0105828.1 NAD(P) transhydrogenase subunit beta [BD1-7 clade bacterium]
MTAVMFINLCYIASAIMFIFGLKLLSSPATARRGNALSAAGMLLAILVTLLFKLKLPWLDIIGGLAIGSAIGAYVARSVKMTSMPEMVALLNGLGGAASLLVGWAALYGSVSDMAGIAVSLSVLIGGVTLTGSLVAYGKLSEKLPGRSITFKNQQWINGALLAVIFIAGFMLAIHPVPGYALFFMVVLSLVLGVMLVIPIGGADMPVVISLLNSYSGLAACAAGLVLHNNLLIVSGALVGASGIILTTIMCKAMNRSLIHVLFSGFEAAVESTTTVEGEVKPIVAEDAYYILEAAHRVVFVPGYGMAVAQAQHVVKELADHLEKNSCEVQFAIHPVAGRMPGHMNVLLAEASVPYDQLIEMDGINPQMPLVDVAIVIGANDVVNPSANDDKSSPLYGMPVIRVPEAKTVIVLKRSMKAGFSGVENPLFFGENTRMLFGDAKESMSALVNQFKDS